jgi:hypothetical protein
LVFVVCRKAFPAEMRGGFFTSHFRSLKTKAPAEMKGLFELFIPKQNRKISGR